MVAGCRCRCPCVLAAGGSRRHGPRPTLCAHHYARATTAAAAGLTGASLPGMIAHELPKTEPRGETRLGALNCVRWVDEMGQAPRNDDDDGASPTN